MKLIEVRTKMENVIVYSQEINKESMRKLHVKCMEEVKRINGVVKFENAYEY